MREYQRRTCIAAVFEHPADQHAVIAEQDRTMRLATKPGESARNHRRFETVRLDVAKLVRTACRKAARDRALLRGQDRDREALCADEGCVACGILTDTPRHQRRCQRYRGEAIDRHAHRVQVFSERGHYSDPGRVSAQRVPQRASVICTMLRLVLHDFYPR